MFKEHPNLDKVLRASSIYNVTKGLKFLLKIFKGRVETDFIRFQNNSFNFFGAYFLLFKICLSNQYVVYWPFKSFLVVKNHKMPLIFVFYVITTGLKER